MNTLKWTLFVFLALLFAHRIFLFDDPDLGWHLAAGKVVVESGWEAPRIDQWSYTLPGHDWVDHEWLSDGIAHLFERAGAMGSLAGIFVLLSLAAPFLWFRGAKSAGSLLLSFIASALLLSIVGVRPQVLSISLFLLLATYLAPPGRSLEGWRTYAIPILFALWANLHGGFVAGLLYLGALLIGRAIDERGWGLSEIIRGVTAQKRAVAILSFSTLATLLNPYGIGLWEEIVIGTMTPMNSEISEWISPLMRPRELALAFLAIAIAIVGAMRGAKPYARTVPIALFLALYLLHARMLPFFLVALMPHLISLSDRLFAALASGIGRRKGAIVEAALVLSLVALFPFLAMSQEVALPYHPSHEGIAALGAIAKEEGITRVYNNYDYGGWIIHDLPWLGVFVDGRSPHWKDEAGFSPFQVQVAIERYGAAHRTLFRTYGIQAAIVSSTERSEHTDDSPSSNAKESEFARFVREISGARSTPALRDRLRDEGWCERYRDGEVAILVSPEVASCARHER